MEKKRLRWVPRLVALLVALLVVAAPPGFGPAGRMGAPPGEVHAQGGEAEEALRLAFHAQAELHGHDDEGVVRSVLLATESLRRAPTAEASEALQAGLVLLPRRVYQWPEGTRLSAVSDDDRRVVLRRDAAYELWALPTPDNSLPAPRRVAPLPLDSDTKGMAFSADGEWLTSWTPDRLQVWRTSDGQPAGAWTPDPAPINRVELSTDGQRLVLIGQAGIQAWDTSNTPQLRELASIPDLGYPLAVSPNGRFIAIASEDGTQVGVWRADSGQLARTIALPRRAQRLLFHPDGTHLVGSDETAVHVWDVESGAEVATVETGNVWPGIAFSPTGKWLITPAAGYWGVDVFAFPPASARLTAAESVLRTWNGDSPGLAFRFSADGRWLARFEGCTQKQCPLWYDVTVWDMERTAGPDDRELNLTLRGLIEHLSFSPDSRWLHTVRTRFGQPVSQLWRLPDGEEVVRLPGYRTQLSPGGRWLFGSSDYDAPLRLWAADPGRHWKAMRHESHLGGRGAGVLAFSPDGRWLATGGLDDVVRVWDVASGDQRAVLAHDDIYYLNLQVGIRDLAFSPDGRRLASLNDGGDLRVWDTSLFASPTITDVQPVARFRTPPWNQVAFSPDGRWLLAGSAWNVATGEVRYEGQLAGGYALGPEGRLLAVREEGTIVLRDFASGETIHQFEHEDGVGYLVFGPAGRRLASVGEKTLVVWDTTSGRRVQRVDLDGQLRGYAVSADGRRIAIGSSDGPPVVWDSEGEAVGRLAPHTVAATPVAFSPDGQSLVVRGPQGHIRLFDLAAGTETAALPRTVRLRGVAFSPDGERLATTDIQGHVRLWWWRPDDLIAAACRHLPRNFTAREWRRYFGDQPYRPTCDELPALAEGGGGW